jgi:hypothetical protein
LSDPIHKEVDFKASPQQVYKALLDSKQFTAFSCAAAESQGDAGGAFSCFDGFISGRNIELVPTGESSRRGESKYDQKGFARSSHSSCKRRARVVAIVEHKGFPDEMRAHLNGERLGPQSQAFQRNTEMPPMLGCFLALDGRQRL